MGTKVVNRSNSAVHCKLRFDPGIFEERFRTIELVFARNDKFQRLLLRFELLSPVYYAFKTLAYTIINMRYCC